MPGYIFIRLDWDPEPCKTRGGDVGLHFKNRFNVFECPNLSTSTPNTEVLVSKLKLQITRDIVILSTYRPPSGDINEFIGVREGIITEVQTKSNVEILIGGDLNINIKNRVNAKVKKYKTVFKGNLWTILISLYTHFNPSNIETNAIDHVLTTELELHSQVKIKSTIPKKLQTVQNCALLTVLMCDEYTPLQYMHDKLKILHYLNVDNFT